MTPDVLLEAAVVVFAATGALALVAMLADRLLPARFARERHDIALAALAVVPLVFAIALLPQAGTTARAESSAAALAPATVPPLPTLAADTAPRVALDAIPPDLPPLLAPALLAIWTIGAAALLARAARDLRDILKLRARATPTSLPRELKLSRKIPVRRSGEVAAPLLAGYLRPAIVVPTDFPLDAAAAPVLEHEVAHARRRDNWTTLALRLLMALFWWNAPLHLVRAIAERAREELCDDHAAAVTGAPHALAGAILDAAAAARRSPRPLAAATHGGALETRVRRLTEPRRARMEKPVATFAVVAPLFALAAVLGTPSVGEAQIAPPAQDGGADPNAADALGEPPLLTAVRTGQQGAVARLLQAGADPNAWGASGETALIAAMRTGDASVVAMLLEAQADPNAWGGVGEPPLVTAARTGDRRLVGMLLDASADPNAWGPATGETPLAIAARSGDTQFAASLLAAGADPNGWGAAAAPPLALAVQSGDEAMIALLLDAGADPNARGAPP